MLILAVDSSAVTASAAVLEDETVVSCFHIHNKLTHSEKLLPMIDAALKFAGYRFRDVGLLAVSHGPGSFTGIRIGIATVKGLAFEAGLPCAAVSTLYALARNAAFYGDGLSDDAAEEYLICPCMDARRDELYNALFLSDGKSLRRLTEDRAVRQEVLLEELNDRRMPAVLTGDGARKLYAYAAGVGGALDLRMAGPLNLLQNAVSVGLCGLEQYRKNETVSAERLVPFYLRESQAEQAMKKQNNHVTQEETK